jgi:hypothetical protein
MGDTAISTEDQIQMDLIEAYDAIQRRYGIDTDAMIIHLRAVLDREIAWAAEQEEEAEPHGWMPCGCDRGCESCGGEGYVYG